MTVTELREKCANTAASAREISDKADVEGRCMTKEEAVNFDKLTAQSEEYRQQADRIERIESIEANLKKPAERKAVLESADKPAVARIDVVTPDYFRFGQLRSFKGPTAERDAYTSGKWLQAVIGNARAREWCRDHGVEIRSQAEGINAAGGYLVPQAMERAIIDLRETYGIFRQNCRVIPLSTDNVVIPRRAGGVTAYFPGENAEITASDASWSQVELTAKKIAALTKISSELNEDAIISITDLITGEMAYAFAVKEDQCGVDGDGTATYGGMIGFRTKMVDGNHTQSYYDAGAGSDNFSEVVADDLAYTMAQLPSYALPGAKWFISQKGKAAVFDRLANALAGNNNVTIAAGAQAQYAGFPIVTMPAMPTTDGAALNDTIMIAFGDLRLSSTLGERRGITIKVSADRYMEYDQIGIQATERFVIVNHDLGNTTVAGPLVGLMVGT